MATIKFQVFICVLSTISFNFPEVFTAVIQPMKNPDIIEDFMVPWIGTNIDGPKSSVTDLPEISFATVRPNATQDVPSAALPVEEKIFTCSERMYGYYADPRHGCKVFHICFPYETPNKGQGLAHYAFECPKPTIFDQRAFVCNYPDEVICEDSEKYYSLNHKLTKQLNSIAANVVEKSMDQDFD